METYEAVTAAVKASGLEESATIEACSAITEYRRHFVPPGAVAERVRKAAGDAMFAAHGIRDRRIRAEVARHLYGIVDTSAPTLAQEDAAYAAAHGCLAAVECWTDGCETFTGWPVPVDEAIVEAGKSEEAAQRLALLAFVHAGARAEAA